MKELLITDTACDCQQVLVRLSEANAALQDMLTNTEAQLSGVGERVEILEAAVKAIASGLYWGDPILSWDNGKAVVRFTGFNQ